MVPMIFFKKKKPEPKPAPAKKPNVPAAPKLPALQTAVHDRVLTAEGWRRRVAAR